MAPKRVERGFLIQLERHRAIEALICLVERVLQGPQAPARGPSAYTDKANGDTLCAIV